MDDGRQHGVGGVTKELTMSELKTSKRRGLIGKVKALLRHPVTFKMAAFVLNLITFILRVIDHFK